MFLLFSFCQGLMSVPSLSTLEGVKRYINAVGNTPSAIAPKQTVMLDWASKEDGSHILTITVGNKVQSNFFFLFNFHKSSLYLSLKFFSSLKLKVLFLTSVSTDITEATVKAMSEKTTISGNRPLKRQSSSMAFTQTQDEVRYVHTLIN